MPRMALPPLAIKTSIILFALLGPFVFPCFLYSQSQGPSYRFPDLYNPNAVAGRLYIQPLGIHDDKVLSSGELSVSYGTFADYNVHFVEQEGDDELTVNTNIYTLTFAHPVDVAGTRLELGGVFRAHQDMRSTWWSWVVKKYHRAFPSDGFGQVPPDDQYYGAVGNNETRVIGKSREFYLNTLQLHAKYQVFTEDRHLLNMAVKLSTRIPLSGKSFDRPGLGLSAGFSKALRPGLNAIGSAGLSFQDLDKRDFNADNLDVSSWVLDLFGGLMWDMGDPGGWYAQAGMRYSSERVSYSANPDSADGGVVVHFGPVYRFREKNGRIMEWFLSCSEDIPGLGYGLEPDVGGYTGFSILFQ